DRLRDRKFLPGAVGDMNGGEGRSRDELSVSLLGPQLALPPRDPAARQREARHPGAGNALEYVVVDAAQLRPGGDGFGRGRIPHHEIGVRSDGDRSLARIDVENA